MYYGYPYPTNQSNDTFGGWRAIFIVIIIIFFLFWGFGNNTNNNNNNCR